MENLLAFLVRNAKDKNGACVGSGCRVYGGEAPRDESGIESCAHRGKRLSSTPVLRLHAQREGVPFETINIQPQRQKPRSHSQPTVSQISILTDILTRGAWIWQIDASCSARAVTYEFMRVFYFPLHPLSVLVSLSHHYSSLVSSGRQKQLWRIARQRDRGGLRFISQGDFWSSCPQTETLTSCPHNKKSITQTSAPLFL